MKRTALIPALILTALTATSAHAQLKLLHNFDDETLGPWHACTVKEPNYTAVKDGRVVTWWTSEGYDGGREDRGAEACCDDFYSYKEGWYGLTIEIGDDYPRETKAGIAQVFGWQPGFWTWEAQLMIDHGDLTIVHRSKGGESGKTEAVVVKDFEYSKEADIVMHFVLSKQEKGLFEIWVDGEKKYHAENINFGLGKFDENDVKIGDITQDLGSEEAGSLTTLKFGQYNFNSKEYKENETRTVYYDNVTWFDGADGYDVVDPAREDFFAE